MITVLSAALCKEHRFGDRYTGFMNTGKSIEPKKEGRNKLGSHQNIFPNPYFRPIPISETSKIKERVQAL